MLDELLHHLVTEMAMDGEEGCSVARLDGFIESYYARRKAQYPAEPMQFVDASYKNFVWKKLCQLDKVRLGVLEPNVIHNQVSENNSINESDVNIASPLPSESTSDTSKQTTLNLPIVASNAANKMTQRPNRLTKSVKRRGIHGSGITADSAPPALSIGQIRALETGKVQKSFQISPSKRIKLDKSNSKSSTGPPLVWKELDPNLGSLSRDELISKFGLDEEGESRLKIAVDPMTCWKAVVGTDTRSPKLTPYVYQVLSIVAQGREAGATVIELGQKLKHDQKSLFHFVKVLIDMQLVVKFRAYQHKAWTNRVVHRRYLATSEWYNDSIKKDEDHTTSSNSHIQPLPDLSFSGLEVPPLNTFTEQMNGDKTLRTLAKADPGLPTMSPIDRQILAVNEKLIKSRMMTVLKRSLNNTMIHADIIKAIGILNPTKDERRRLNRIIDSYIKRGLLERVAIANVSGYTPCIRLTNLGEESSNETPIEPQPANAEPDDNELDEELRAVPLTRSIGQTTFDLVTSSGQEGITYKVLCNKLNDIEIRTVEQILSRMEREQGPPHLSDLKVTSVLETFGREKRVRWFSAESLKSKCETSGIQLPSDDDHRQPASVGGFMEIDPSTLHESFYQNASQLYSVMVPELKGHWGRRSKKASSTKAEARKKSVGGITPAVKKTRMNDRITPTPICAPHNANHITDSKANPTNDAINLLPAKKRAIAESSINAEPKKRTKRGSGKLGTTMMTEPLPIERPTEVLDPSVDPTSADAIPNSITSPPQVATLANPSNQLQTPTQMFLCTPGSQSKTRNSRQNWTLLHREYHLLEAIKFAGGIVEKSNELSKAVRDLVDRADRDDIVGLMDNRTLNFALHGLEMRGEIKASAVLVTDALGVPCYRKIIYLPSIDLDSAEIRKWFDGLKVRFKTLDKASESRVNEHKDFASPLYRPNQKPSQNRPLLPDGLGINDEALRAAFLNQWRCLSQLYGFVLGKAARARILHLYLLNTFQNLSHSSASRLIIDSGHRVFSSTFLFQELPVGVFAKLVPIMTKSEEFEELRNTPGALTTPMGNSSLAIRRVFQMGNQFSRAKVYQIVEILFHLKLLIPLQKSQDFSEYYHTSENKEVCYYSPTTMCARVGLFCLANEGLVYDFAQKVPNPPTLLSKCPLKNELDGEIFWEQLKRGSIPNPASPPTRSDIGSVEDEKIFRGPPKIIQLLTDESKWRDCIQLTPVQRQYIAKFVKLNDSSANMETDDNVVVNIAHVLVTAPGAVRQAILEFRDAIALSRAKTAKAQLKKKNRKKQGNIEVDAEKLKSIQQEAARVLSDKAKNLLQQKEVDWNSLIKRFKSQSNITEIDEEVLKDLHTLFITHNGGINVNQVESELAAWLARKQTAEKSAADPVEQGGKLLVEIETSIGSSKRDRLPMLPSTKAKRIKMLNVNSTINQSAGWETKKLPIPPRRYPEKPKKISPVAANAIRPQLNVQPGVRPTHYISRSGRMRLDWNDTLDDFLQDMVAIMRARAYATSTRVLPWPITLRIFKGAKTHILRHRYAKIERDPKERRYLDLLTEAWTQVYFDKRGKVPELADPMPSVPAQFDGGLALDYLRANIDKTYLRSQVSTSEKEEKFIADHTLPDTYSELRAKYFVKRISHLSRPERWDDFYSFSNVGREMNIITEALSASSRQPTKKCRPSVSHEVLRAAEAIKLLTSTPIKAYSEPIAVAVLSHYSEVVLTRATDFLCMKGVIAMGGKVHYKKRLPGRSYCYTDRFLSDPQTRALQESREISLARLRSQSLSAADGTLTWSLFASDMETASLLHAYSRGEVSLTADLTPNRSKRWDNSNFYRSRQLDDHCIENIVRVRFKESCATKVLPRVTKQPTPSQLEAVEQAVLHAGAGGITPQQLIDQFSYQIPSETLSESIQVLTKLPSAKLYWACNEEDLILFSSSYLENWAEKVYSTKENNDNDQNQNVQLIKKEETHFLVPRLWFDLSGNLVENLFKLSLHRVENMVLSLPGIPYTELRRRTKLNLNCLELDDILYELIHQGKIIQSINYDNYNNNSFLLFPSSSQPLVFSNTPTRGFNHFSHFWILP